MVEAEPVVFLFPVISNSVTNQSYSTQNRHLPRLFWACSRLTLVLVVLAVYLSALL